jgi:hypothetical protein
MPQEYTRWGWLPAEAGRMAARFPPISGCMRQRLRLLSARSTIESPRPLITAFSA